MMQYKNNGLLTEVDRWKGSEVEHKLRSTHFFILYKCYKLNRKNPKFYKSIEIMEIMEILLSIGLWKSSQKTLGISKD